MKTLIGGAVAAVLGLIGMSVWWKPFLQLLAGAIPVTLLLGGGLALYLGFDELKDTWKKEEPSFEVIPTMSEPQSSLPQLEDSTMDATVSPRLPYADKIWEPPTLSLLADPDGNSADVGDVEARARIH